MVWELQGRVVKDENKTLDLKGIVPTHIKRLIFDQKDS